MVIDPRPDVRRLMLARLDGHVEDVILYGSFARGDAGQASDVDVVVKLRPGAPADLLGRVREDLAASTIPYNVDVVDWNDAPAALRANIAREGVSWLP